MRTADPVRDEAIRRARERDEEDFFAVLLPEAAEHAITTGWASLALLIRRMRVGVGMARDLIVELRGAAVIGAPQGDAREPDTRYLALVKPERMDGVLSRLRDEDDTDHPVVVDGELVDPDETEADETALYDDCGGDEGDDDWPDPYDDDPVDLDDLAGTSAGANDDGDIDPHATLALRPRAPLALNPRTVRQHLLTVWRRTGDAIAGHHHSRRVVRTVGQVPRAGWRTLAWSPRGLWRDSVRVVNWLVDFETRDLMAHHAENKMGPEYERVANARHTKNLPARRIVFGSLATVALVLSLAWWGPPQWLGAFAALAAFGGVLVFAPRRNPEHFWQVIILAFIVGIIAWPLAATWGPRIPHPPLPVWIGLGIIALIRFGHVGKAPGKSLIEPVRGKDLAPPPILTPALAIDALISLGNPKMKEPDQVSVMLDPHRTGAFLEINLQLPPGVSAVWVMERRGEYAGALRRPEKTVWLQVGDAHPSHLRILVSNIPMNEMEQNPWPLLSSGPIDIFKPVPVFTDQLGNWVYMNLAYASWIIGAVPRMGKTFFLRQLLLIYGMDPRVKVIGWDGKATGDLMATVPFAFSHVRGARVDKPENVEKVLETVRWLLREMGRRADVIAGLPFEECPDSKVTSELIDAHPEMDLGPIALGMDETQAFFTFGFKSNKVHKAIREEIRDGVIELMRMGPALGIWVILATQTVRDSTIPTEAQAVAVYRFCLRVDDWAANDKVLGTGAHKAGITATVFSFAEKGFGWFKGEGSEPQIGRTVFGLDSVAARTLAMKCRSWRVAKGLLRGEATEETADAVIVANICDDTLRVMREHHTTKAHYAELIEWLTELRPEYRTLDERSIGKRLRAEGIVTGQVWHNNANDQGVDLRKQPGAMSR